MYKLASKEAHYLVQLGLSKQEAMIYTILWEKGAMSAEKIAKEISCLPQAASRSAKKLESHHLVNSNNSYPHLYQAITPSIALSDLAKKKALFLESTADEIANRMSHKIPNINTSMNLIPGKEESYLYGAQLLNKTKKEMLVISIGEAISEELLLSVKTAHERGVTIRMITQQYDEKNKEILENFKKNGYEIRHAPSKGFHLAIYDGEQSLLIVDNEKQPTDRAAIHIKSTGLSQALRGYFLQLWETAISV